MTEAQREKYSLEEIEEIAVIKVLSTYGVSRMHMLPAAYLPETILGKSDRNSGIHMSKSGNNLIFDVYCDVAYGCKIPETAWNIQENVKSAIEKKTDYKVEKVNIHIEGITK